MTVRRLRAEMSNDEYVTWMGWNQYRNNRRDQIKRKIEAAKEAKSKLR